MISLRISVQGEKEVLAVLGGMERATSDLTPYWPAVVTIVREIESEAFQTEGSSTRSGRWQALDPRYAAWKARRYPGRGILERTLDLRASLIGGPGSDVRMEPMQLTIESHVPYGSFHQEGQGVPKRAPWDPTDRDAFRIADVVSKGLRRAFAALESAA